MFKRYSFHKFNEKQLGNCLWTKINYIKSHYLKNNPSKVYKIEKYKLNK